MFSILIFKVHPGETMNASAPELTRAFVPRDFGSFLDEAARARARRALGMCDACPFSALQLNGFLLALERGGLRLVSHEPVSTIGSKVEMTMLHPLWHPHRGMLDARLCAGLSV